MITLRQIGIIAGILGLSNPKKEMSVPIKEIYPIMGKIWQENPALRKEVPEIEFAKRGLCLYSRGLEEILFKISDSGLAKRNGDYLIVSTRHKESIRKFLDEKIPPADHGWITHKSEEFSKGISKFIKGKS